MDNPFERYGLDPTEGIGAITQRLKELAEDATDEAERQRIREAWEELTLHPTRRLRAALFAHPDTSGPRGAPPPRPRPRVVPAFELGLRDIVLRPSLLATIVRTTGQPDVDADPASSLEDDPVLRSSG